MKNFFKKIFRKKDSTRKFGLYGDAYNLWYSIPMVRVVIPFIFGILLENFFENFINEIIFSFLIFTFLYFLSINIKWFYQKYEFRIYNGFLINIILFFAGIILSHNIIDIHKTHHYSTFEKKGKYIQAMLDDEPSLRKKFFRVKARVKNVITDNENFSSCGNILLYIKNDSNAQHLKYGDNILFTYNPQQVKKPLNPHEFDFCEYLKRNNIYYNEFIKENEWRILPEKSGNILFTFSYSIKEKIFSLYKKYIPGRIESGVAAALIFGYREELDAEIVQQYAHTGTLHVLAVSGLHVGIIYIVLKLLLKVLMTTRYLKILRCIIIIFTLWFYALLTGFSPSVLRATIMFSFIVAGETLRRTPNIYNSLASSAFCLLLYNPLFIYDVGFQLSYSAVLGIVFLHPHIYKLYTTSTWLGEQAWNISGVSVAAQLATCSFGFYYFHQFPVYFLLANLIIIPTSTIITYFGLLLVLFSPIEILSSYIGFVTGKLIEFTNTTVAYIDAAPYSTLNGLVMTLEESILCFIVLFFITVFSIYHIKIYLYISLFSLLIFSFSKTFHFMKVHDNDYVFIYSVPQNTCIEIMHENKSVIFGDSSFYYDPKGYRFRLQNNSWYHYITENKFISSSVEKVSEEKFLFEKYNELLNFNGKKILIINREIKNKININVDLILLSHNPKISLEQLTALVQCRKIVIDQSNSQYKINKWKKEAVEKNIQIYITNEQGAYEMKIEK